MKKALVCFISLVLILSLAACGKSGKTDPSVPDGTAATEAPAPEETTEEAADAPQDDAAAIEALQERLTGTWGFPGNGGEDAERITFRADGTGDYQSLANKHFTFTYELRIDHRTYANGAPYTVNMFTVTCDTGETEDNVFFFTDDGNLAFRSSDESSYSGVFDYIESFKKE